MDIDWEEVCEFQDYPQSYYKEPPNEHLTKIKNLKCMPAITKNGIKQPEGGVCCATPYRNSTDLFSQELWSSEKSQLPDVQIDNFAYVRKDLLTFWTNLDNVLCEWAPVSDLESIDYHVSMAMHFQGMLAKRPKAELFFRNPLGGFFHWSVFHQVDAGKKHIDLVHPPYKVPLGNLDEDHWEGGTFGTPQSVFKTELTAAEVELYQDRFQKRFGPQLLEECMTERLQQLITSQYNYNTPINNNEERMQLVRDYFKERNCQVIPAEVWAQLLDRFAHVLPFLIQLQKQEPDLHIITILLIERYIRLKNVEVLLLFLSEYDIGGFILTMADWSDDEKTVLLTDLLRANEELFLTKMVQWNNDTLLKFLYEKVFVVNATEFLSKLKVLACQYGNFIFLKFCYLENNYLSETLYNEVHFWMTGEELEEFYVLAYQQARQLPTVETLRTLLDSADDDLQAYPAFLHSIFNWIVMVNPQKLIGKLKKELLQEVKKMDHRGSQRRHLLFLHNIVERTHDSVGLPAALPAALPAPAPAALPVPLRRRSGRRPLNANAGSPYDRSTPRRRPPPE